MKVKIVREESSCSRDEEKELRKARYHELKVEYIKQLLQLDVMTIQCGRLTGKLHKSLFICPGINENCIEFEGKMISPKNFVILAKLRNSRWKINIRFQRTQLHWLFKDKIMDFHNHDQMCTGKCFGKAHPDYHLSKTMSKKKTQFVAKKKSVRVPKIPSEKKQMPSSSTIPTVTQANHSEMQMSPPITPVMMHDIQSSKSCFSKNQSEKNNYGLKQNLKVTELKSKQMPSSSTIPTVTQPNRAEMQMSPPVTPVMMHDIQSSKSCFSKNQSEKNNYGLKQNLKVSGFEYKQMSSSSIIPTVTQSNRFELQMSPPITPVVKPRDQSASNFSKNQSEKNNYGLKQNLKAPGFEYKQMPSSSTIPTVTQSNRFEMQMSPPITPVVKHETEMDSVLQGGFPNAPYLARLQYPFKFPPGPPADFVPEKQEPFDPDSTIKMEEPSDFDIPSSVLSPAPTPNK